MAQTPSIPEELHTEVVDWWLTGLSPRKVRARLFDEYGVVTSHTSVQRVVDHVADGHGSEALLATVTRLRLRSTELLDQLEENLTQLRVEAGLEEPTEETSRRGHLNPQLFDLTDRITIRHLRLAGIGGRAAEQVVQKYEAQQRQLGDARCAMWGVTWPFQAPAEEAATETAATASPLVAAPEAASRVSQAPTIPPPASRAPGRTPMKPPPVPALAKPPPSPALDSVRMVAMSPAMVAQSDAYAVAPRTPAPPPPQGIPAHVAPRRPCPCGSGLRFKHCHGKLRSSPVSESEPSPLAMRPDTARDDTDGSMELKASIRAAPRRSPVTATDEPHAPPHRTGLTLPHSRNSAGLHIPGKP